MEDERSRFEEGSAFESGPDRSASPLDSIKETIAEKLRSAADIIQHKVEGADEQSALNRYGRQASNWLNHSADYVRDIDFDRMKSDIQNQVRQNPGRSLLIAGFAGLIIGSVLRRR